MRDSRQKKKPWIRLLVITLLISQYLAAHISAWILEAGELDWMKTGALLDIFAERPLDVTSFHPVVYAFIYTAGFALYFHILFAREPPRAERKGEEHGSNRFMTPAEVAQFSLERSAETFPYSRDIRQEAVYPKKWQKKETKRTAKRTRSKNTNPRGRSTNILLAENLRLTFNSNAYNGKNINSNGLGWIHQIIIGATGTGKSRYFVRPNIYSLPTDPVTGRAISLVITDPKGELLDDCGAFLEAHGYVVKVFNLFDMGRSDCYNPFAYIREENDVAVLVGGIVVNMGEGKNQGDHWEANARYVLNSICYYIYYEKDYQESNFATVLQLLNEWESSEKDEFRSAYDRRMEELEERKGADHAAVVWWRKVSAKGQELSSIISTAQTITGIFAQTAIRTMTATDSMELDMVGDRPTALFIITPPTTKVFNFLAALMYTQLFTLLQNKANRDYREQGRVLPHKVWFILDEFSNIGKIPDFDIQITLIRSAGMFCSIIVQSPSQIEAIYDKITPTILSNCSITLFLGASGNTQKDDSAADFISRNLGNMTIAAESSNVDYTANSHNPKITRSYNATQRPVMTPDEVKRLPADECIILLGGQFPVRTKKIRQLEKCMNYDVFLEVGHYRTGERKNTTLTYQEGRERSSEIEEIQQKCRDKEAEKKKAFDEVDRKYMPKLEESIKPEESTPATSPFVPFLEKFTREQVEREMIPSETKVFNWRAEFEEADVT